MTNESFEAFDAAWRTVYRLAFRLLGFGGAFGVPSMKGRS